MTMQKIFSFFSTSGQQGDAPILAADFALGLKKLNSEHFMLHDVRHAFSRRHMKGCHSLAAKPHAP